MKAVLGAIGLLLVAAPAQAQVPCVRHDLAFACADGTSLAIYDDPWRRGGLRMGGGGSGRGPGDWWKDDRYVYGPDGEVCLQHGNHVHCGGSITDP